MCIFEAVTLGELSLDIVGVCFRFCFLKSVFFPLNKQWFCKSISIIITMVIFFSSYFVSSFKENHVACGTAISDQ
jgi:hypothetical protein